MWEHPSTLSPDELNHNHSDADQEDDENEQNILQDVPTPVAGSPNTDFIAASILELQNIVSSTNEILTTTDEHLKRDSETSITAEPEPDRDASDSSNNIDNTKNNAESSDDVENWIEFFTDDEEKVRLISFEEAISSCRVNIYFDRNLRFTWLFY